MILENDKIKLKIDEKTGAISSFIIKKTGCDMIGEQSLLENFLLTIDQKGNIDGMQQEASIVESSEKSAKFIFLNFHIDEEDIAVEFSFEIILDDDQVKFRSKTTNNSSFDISQIWFPRIGGWTKFNNNENARLATPGYMSCQHDTSLFKGYPGQYSDDMEGAVFSIPYPGMMMPWWDIYDEVNDMGIYLGYHDPIFRISQWNTILKPTISGKPDDAWLKEDETEDEPVGMIFSHIRFPYVKENEVFDSGEFVIMIHEGDWHTGSLLYREWFMDNFPFDKSNNWLRKESAWFTSIIYQPEDKVLADYDLYGQWCQEAQEYDVNCFELIGWDKGGLERDYPEYEPAEVLGGRKGFRKLLKSIEENDGKSLIFNNYNILDTSTEWYEEELHKYRCEDPDGFNPNWMAWGEGTLSARSQTSVNRHVACTITPRIKEILQDYFIKLVEDGADGFQIDKLCVGSFLDFNSLAEDKPDVVNAEGMIKAIGELYEKCKEINPDFCMASEATQDRLLPYIDVYYRCAIGHTITPLRYVFPECTAAQHISMPYDYKGVNGAIVTGAVLCIEPEGYTNSLGSPMWRKFGRYIQEVERIRKELFDIIFLGRFLDTLEAEVQEIQIERNDEQDTGAEVDLHGPGVMFTEKSSSNAHIHYGVHQSYETGKRAIVVSNDTENERIYSWKFKDADNSNVLLYSPLEEVKEVSSEDPVKIKGLGLHILVSLP